MTGSVTGNWRSRLGTIFSASPFHGEAGEPLPSPEREPVLVVMDDEARANECASSLRALGYEPLVARSAHEATGLFLSRPVGIAILDCHMPDGDVIALGRELTRHAEAGGNRLHVILATGYAAKDVAIDAMRGAAVDFLEKPAPPADLRKALQRIRELDAAPATREALLRSMSGLRAELQHLLQLIDDPDEAAPSRLGRSSIFQPPPAGVAGAAEPSTPALASHIRDLLKREAKRRGIGGGDVFGDPAWEMLLDLMLAKIEGRRVPVSSACIASGAPMSTALRLVGRLVDAGVLRKLPDETDRRRHFLIINPRFEAPLLEYLTDQLRDTPRPDRR